ncbi:unnamed protein product [Urochloa decumbens]|uniref:Uncharacterized protein n=1 Tax=Urochloa decumbens TaxID=240449 RepID=A0ABC9G5I7_9POAL
MASPAFFVAAYSEAGLSVRCSSEKGASVLRPYTDDEEAHTTAGCGSACLAATSKTLTSPATLDATYACGASMAYRTPACAARWSTCVNAATSKSFSRRGVSLMSASTTATPRVARSACRARFRDGS